MASGGRNSSNSKSEGMQWSISTSNARTKDSALSNAQLKILQDREALFNDTFFPEFKSAISNIDQQAENSNVETEKLGTGLMKDSADAINLSYDASQKQTRQNLAQQGLLGKGSGVSAALTAANERSRSSALADAYYKTLQDKASLKQQNIENQTNWQNQKNTLLGVGATLMTTPTTSAQYHNESSSSSKSFGHDQAKASSNGNQWGVLN